MLFLAGFVELHNKVGYHFKQLGYLVNVSLSSTKNNCPVDGNVSKGVNLMEMVLKEFKLGPCEVNLYLSAIRVELADSMSPLYR